MLRIAPVADELQFPDHLSHGKEPDDLRSNYTCCDPLLPVHVSHPVEHAIGGGGASGVDALVEHAGWVTDGVEKRL